VEQVTTRTGRALGTTWGYLAEFIQNRRPEGLEPWINQRTYRSIADAVKALGTEYLQPVFERLGGKVPYEQIRLVVAHLNATRDRAR
jgi:hypothetical protein